MPFGFKNPFALPSFRSQFNDQFIEEESPRAAFGIMRRYGGGSPMFLDWLERQADSVWQEYLGEIARDPGIRWLDFLANYDFNQAFAKLHPSQRGERPGLLIPSLRRIL